jgi:hypothetical protein
MPDAGNSLPVTEEVASKVLLLATGPTVGEGEILTICGIIHRAAAESAAVRKALPPPDSAASSTPWYRARCAFRWWCSCSPFRWRWL